MSEALDWLFGKVKKIIFSKNLLLRKIDPQVDDLTDYLAWLRDTNNNQFIQTARKDYQYTELVEYINLKNGDPNSLLFGIFVKRNRKLIGTIKLEPIDLERRYSWVGIMIGDVDSRGHGFGYESMNAILKYAQNNLKLNQIFLGVNKNNEIALKLYKKMGFRIVGESSNDFKMSKSI